MKKLQILLLFILPIMAMAQPPAPPRPPKGGMFGPGRQMKAEHQNRLQALSVAHLTKVLNLTPVEAEKFWPVYNKYNEEVRKAVMDSTQRDVLDKQQEVLNIRRKYQKDFQKILSPERAQKIYKAEMEFRNMVRKELEDRRQMDFRRRAMDSKRKEMDGKRKEMDGRRKEMDQKRTEFQEKQQETPSID